MAKKASLTLIAANKVSSITARCTPLGFALTITGRNAETDADAVIDITFDWSWMFTLADWLRDVVSQRACETQAMIDRLAGK